jgi:hypothetical protein
MKNNRRSHDLDAPRILLLAGVVCLGALLGACGPNQRVTGVRQAGASDTVTPQTTSPADFFESSRPLAFTLALDFVLLARSKAYERARMAFGEEPVLEIEAKVGSETGPKDCAPLALALRLPKEAKETATPFSVAREVEMRTHCFGGSATAPPEADPVGAWRQAAIHDVLDAAGVAGARARRALVTFDLPKETPFVRLALLLEGDDAVAVRMGGAALSTSDIAALGGDVDGFSPQGVLEHVFAQALVGNADWSFPAMASDAEGQRGARNLWVVDRGSGAAPRYVPYARRFELSSWVTGRTLEKARTTDEGMKGESDIMALQTNTMLVAARDSILGAALFEKHFAASAKRFLEKEDSVRSALDAAAFSEHDGEGRSLARKHVDGFYKVLKARIGD